MCGLNKSYCYQDKYASIGRKIFLNQLIFIMTYLEHKMKFNL